MKNTLKHLKARSEIIIGRIFILFGLIFLVLSFVNAYSFFIIGSLDASILFIVSGILFLYRSTRQLGWFMAGCISAITLYGFVAGEPLFTEPELNYATYLLFGIWIVLCIWFCLKCELDKEEVGDKYDNKINELERKNRKLEDLLTELKERLPEEELMEDEEYDNSVLVEDKPKGKLLKRPDKQVGEKRMKLYENQLISLFKIALFANSNNDNPRGLNYIEDGSDKELDDLIAQTENIFWLLEVKRDREDIAGEEAKPKRRAQFKALMSAGNDAHKNIARRCHWLGWSEEEEDTLLFSNYWGTVFDAENTPHITFRRFVELTFNDSNPIGSTYESFDQYICFLFEAGGEVTSNNGSPTVITFCKSETGDINMTEVTLFELYTAMQHAKNRKKGMGIYPLDVD